eukprot:CAMPEP_0178995334 /NCGR_PEP_ID=MMETSP0795-20121207/7776_1 /TAXON_ID=88552 /ORGANISM="Amoebophrya sp., Strain Ameob2" /LENGTH=231 /DNA_ID=CAMNT_0020687643 /DNA_START=156 /DNA_END=850 /DNA_ORIENTATION=+
MNEHKKRPRDEHLATLLTTADPPTKDEYATKKVELARKMDRLEFVSKARMTFIKGLHANNEKKRDAILCRPPGKLQEVSQKGLVEADVMFESLKQEHIKRKSIPKRLNIVHNYCVHLEVQQARGMQKAEQMDPLPSPELFPEVTFTDFNPTYSDLLANEPSPFRSVDEQTGEPVDAGPPDVRVPVAALLPTTPGAGDAAEGEGASRGADRGYEKARKTAANRGKEKTSGDV